MGCDERTFSSRSGGEGSILAYRKKPQRLQKCWLTRCQNVALCAKPISYEQIDGKINMEGLHSPVRQPSPTIQWGAGVSHVISDRYSCSGGGLVIVAQSSAVRFSPSSTDSLLISVHSGGQVVSHSGGFSMHDFILVPVTYTATVGEAKAALTAGQCDPTLSGDMSTFMGLAPEPSTTASYIAKWSAYSTGVWRGARTPCHALYLLCKISSSC